MITDLQIYASTSKINTNIKNGYTLIKQDLNEGARGEYIYLAYKTGGGSPITSINIFSMDNAIREDVSSINGFTIIRYDLNKGAGGKYIYLGYKKGGSSPITSINIFSMDDQISGNELDDFTIIRQDLNEGAGGKYIYLGYKK